MADAVVTLKARKKMVQARAGAITLPPIVGMVFGTGGVDEAGMPVAPSGSDEGLKQEIFRKELDSYTFTDDTTCRYLCTLEVGECDNEEISEIGLYDENGDVVCIKTFKRKGKDDDVEQTYTLDDIF